ncbi:MULTISPECIES: HAD family hydrolase [unclassified Oceanobacter]|uniref:HAD family hydrolase n=1 Tax=unclassified Oceanobacter TaxID=2620260 RepID=UPI0027328424|nr:MULTISPECIES: HAD family hydrolase [unclassified Oceanobacter]MDP2505457.1 HAD family hydrolase [Oceanobacter sp. 3_MG-2023]MDP2548602.1 HAD family hydrolase [Oceanobacter sp. 4_MG-2023]
MALKLITLDLDDTLWHTAPVMQRAEQACYDWICAQCPGFADLYSRDGLRQYKSELAECYPSLQHQISRLRFETLRRAALQTGCDSSTAHDLASAAFEVFSQERSTLELFAGAETMLQQLSARWPLIAATNGNADLERVGIHHYFSAHLNAETVGAAKPQGDIFLAALAHAGVEAHECLHIGDHPHHDIDAARTVGLHTLWVNLDNRIWPDTFSPPTLQVRTLSEVVELIQRWQQP